MTGTKSQALAEQAAAKAKLDAAKGKLGNLAEIARVVGETKGRQELNKLADQLIAGMERDMAWQKSQGNHAKAAQIKKILEDIKN